MPLPTFQPPVRPVPVILDTDMATDCDDAGAMAVLHALATRGEAAILAIVADNRDPASIGAVAAINAYYGRPHIPLGAYQGDEVGATAASFVRELAADTTAYGHTVIDRSQVPSAVEVYRRALATAADGSVIISIGHLNNLADILASGPDIHSTLPGAELIRRKVSHWVVMGGDYPAGQEHNFFARGSAPFAVRAIAACPVPVLFSGFTLGADIVTGPALAKLPAGHPVRRAYASHGSRPLENGRPSWDQTAILAAIRDPRDYWTITGPGTNIVAPDGSNTWHPAADGRHDPRDSVSDVPLGPKRRRSIPRLLECHARHRVIPVRRTERGMESTQKPGDMLRAQFRRHRRHGKASHRAPAKDHHSGSLQGPDLPLEKIELPICHTRCRCRFVVSEKLADRPCRLQSLLRSVADADDVQTRIFRLSRMARDNDTRYG